MWLWLRIHDLMLWSHSIWCVCVVRHCIVDFDHFIRHTSYEMKKKMGRDCSHTFPGWPLFYTTNCVRKDDNLDCLVWACYSCYRTWPSDGYQMWWGKRVKFTKRVMRFFFYSKMMHIVQNSTNKLHRMVVWHMWYWTQRFLYCYCWNEKNMTE